MRLAFVLPGLGAGGAERVVSRLAEHWAARGHEVHLLLLSGPDERPYYPLPPSVRLTHLGLLGRSRGPLDAARANLRRIHRLRRALAEAAPAAVLAFLPETGALTSLAALGTGVPVIVSERCSPPDEPLPAPWRALRWLAYRAAAAVVFQTERARAVFPGAIRARGAVIPNPVTIPAEPSADPQAQAIVAAGRLVAQKGFDALIRAFADSAARHPGWTLTIWGEGPERPALETLAGSLGLAGRVRLPGNSTEPGAWLAGGASIFALPSRFEGFPNALCEAMAAGHAVVAADCRFGPREIIAQDGGDGLLVPVDDHAALAAALSGLMADPARRAALGAAARRSIRRLDLPAVAARWETLVLDLAAERGPVAAAAEVSP